VNLKAHVINLKINKLVSMSSTIIRQR